MKGASCPGHPLLERLSAADHYLVLGDDFGWPWDIGVVAVVDGARLLDGNGQLAAGRVRRWVEPRLHLVPRFRQVLCRPSWGLGWPVWADAQSFGIAEHVRVYSLPVPAGESELLAACERLCGQRLDPARPLWRLWLLPGLPGQRVGLLMRMHRDLACCRNSSTHGRSSRRSPRATKVMSGNAEVRKHAQCNVSYSARS